MQTMREIQETCFVDFRKYLNEKLQDPVYKKEYEVERKKACLQVMINDLLQDTGHGEYCVEVMGIDEY